MQNSFVKAELTAGLVFPFFENKDEPIDVTVGFGVDGSAVVKLDRTGGKLVEIEKEGVLRLTLSSIGFKYEAGVFTVSLSGEISPCSTQAR